VRNTGTFDVEKTEGNRTRIRAKPAKGSGKGKTKQNKVLRLLGAELPQRLASPVFARQAS
jgi:hypothetical protein